MGNSMPPPASFDLVDSAARRRGADVEIVFAEPKSDIAGTSVEVSLDCAARQVRAHGELAEDATGRRLTVRVPRADLEDGTWTLTLEHEAGERQQLAARLLVQGDRPLVLLWGATGSTSVAAPPRSQVSASRKAVAVGGRALDQALTLLPAERAVRLRGAARSIARRLLR